MDPRTARIQRRAALRHTPRARSHDAAAVVPYLAADAIARVLPRPALESLARAAARLAFVLRVPARSRLEANLTEVLRADRTAACETFEHFALAFVDFLRLGRIGRAALERAIVVNGDEHYRAARAAGRGVIVLSAHTGNWEWGAAFLAARGTPVHLVARPHASAFVESFFADRRAAWGVSRLCGRPLWLAAATALRRNEWIAMMGDRPAPGTRASLYAWAVALARRTGAVVLPATMRRLPDGRYLANFDPPLDAETSTEGRWREALLNHLRETPGQWFAFEPVPALLGGAA